MDFKKDIYNIHDKSYKDLYSNKEVFLDLVREMLKANWAQNLKADDLTLINKSYILADYNEKESDIVYNGKIGENEVIFYILLEFQSSVDYRMPLRLFFYISELLREYCKNANHKPSDKNIKIPAVIPIVLYNGNSKWDAKTTFSDMIDGSELFGDNIINFKYDIFDINNTYTKEELISNNNMTSAIFLLDQKINPVEFLERIKAIALFFNNLTDKDKSLIKNWIKNTVEDELAETAIDILSATQEEVEKMVASNATMLKDALEDAKNKGNLEGKLEERYALATNLLDILDDETISLKTKLTIAEVAKLRAQNETAKH